jgi:hypothetical protein
MVQAIPFRSLIYICEIAFNSYRTHLCNHKLISYHHDQCATELTHLNFQVILKSHLQH